MTEESGMYIMRVIYAGRFCYVKNYTPIGKAPSGKREKRMKESPEAMKKYNNERRSEKLQLLILTNFDKGYHLTLDYPKGCKPSTYKEAEENLTRTLYKVSRRLKAKGKQFKYIAVTERGKKAAALHHHMIIEHDPVIFDELIAVWGQRIHASVMYEEGQYKELAEYIVKMETKEEASKGKSKYHRSRNLINPIERVAMINKPLGEDPFIPKGYRLVGGSFRSGFNEVIHIRWQKYMLEQIGHATMSQKTEGSEQKCIKRESIFTRFKNKFLRRRK